MWYIVVLCLIVLGLLFSCNNRANTSDNDKYRIVKEDTVYFNSGKDSITPLYSRDEIEKKLQRLAKKDPPKTLAIGAMCYEMAAIPDTISYVCPACNEKTLYKRDEVNNYRLLELINWELSNCRNIVKNIKGINIVLDESELCKHCSPGVKEPELCLLVNINNNKDTNRVCNISSQDLTLIAEFLDDKLVHVGEADYESPLKDHIDRIQELMGVKLKEKND